MAAKRFVAALLCAVLLFVLMPVYALADTSYSYVDADGSVKTTIETVTVLSGPDPGTTVTLTTGWYIVLDAGVTRNWGIIVNGDVHLILADGASLTVTIPSSAIAAAINVPGTSSLTIYGQTSGTGRLLADANTTSSYGAGIGGGADEACGTVTINSGTVEANGSQYGAGIGGGYEGIGGSITINGGTVTASGHYESAAIGSGAHGSGGFVTITGGKVTAAGVTGIGSGAYSSDGGTVRISGGTVSATGFNGAGIGGGFDCDSGTITIIGGTVNACSSYGAGIGGGVNKSGGTVYISGGSVNASSENAQAIGYGYGGTGSGTLQNDSIDQTPVCLTTVTIVDRASTPMSSVSIASLEASCTYNTNDMHTDANGKLYLYLPAGTHTTGAAASQGWPYAGNITTASDGSGAGTLSPLIVVKDVQKTSSSSSGDTYTITYSDGSTGTFTVINGADGKSAYELAVENGYTGTLQQWLTSLAGTAGAAGANGTDGREIELQTSGGYIKWRYSGETTWHNLIALSALTGATGAKGDKGDRGDSGAAGAQGAQGSKGDIGETGETGQNGRDGNGIVSIAKTGTQGNVDTYTVAMTDGTQATFTVTNGKDGKDGVGITGAAFNEKGELVLTLTDGKQLNAGKAPDESRATPASATVFSGKSSADTKTGIAFAVAALALLAHLGWLIPHLRRGRTPENRAARRRS